ncbi:Flavinator of succinate dehydrogenase-domain-containing protein [Gilbertella persicaria]|uniref:Flavinator of succinate dehydrogenase-domain-containing protein n=1 Tax=Gilbertella persicaria TaxID=101096 RepID=UPI00221FCA61|nr:Flavinator of succinate dehydrogenase-domain-containing protein [Gilbertella persicaria]KAI8075909.1 Flavinator of succinate dehydrogenase-domain-containing protein [Gilbertella persicaria]
MLRVFRLQPRIQLRSLSQATPLFKLKDHGDPFPDLAIRHSSEAALDSSYPNLPPIPRPNETTENKRRRLTYQSRKRGILETDLLLSTFAKNWLPAFDHAQLEEYDKLLDEPDWDIFYWATNKKPIPARWQESKVLAMIKEHAKNEDKKVLRMPDLETKDA